MKHFLIYTSEGYTESPTMKPIENHQILGTSEATDEIEAIEKLFKKETWLVENGFTIKEAKAIETVMPIWQ